MPGKTIELSETKNIKKPNQKEDIRGAGCGQDGSLSPGIHRSSVVWGFCWELAPRREWKCVSFPIVTMT